MERDKLITRATNEFIENNLLEGFSNILEDVLENNSVYMKEIMWAFEQLFQKGIKKQRAEIKGEVAFVVISFLHNSFFSETFEFQIELFDENYLADKNPIVWKYAPSFIEKHYITEWTSYEKHMKNKIIQLKKNEIYPFRLMLADKYKKVMESIFAEYIPFVVRLLSYKELIKSDDIKILYGDYYGKCVEIN